MAIRSERTSVCIEIPRHITMMFTVRLRGIETGISETSKRVPIFSFATQRGKQESFYFRQGN